MMKVVTRISLLIFPARHLPLKTGSRPLRMSLTSHMLLMWRYPSRRRCPWRITTKVLLQEMCRPLHHQSRVIKLQSTGTTLRMQMLDLHLMVSPRLMLRHTRAPHGRLPRMLINLLMLPLQRTPWCHSILLARARAHHLRPMALPGCRPDRHLHHHRLPQ